MQQFGRRELEVTVSTTAGAETRRYAMAGIGENEEFLGFIRAGEVRSMHTMEASLDDIFIEATGSPK
jgi:fluoroquinolone transport system ATP-binding protein